MDEWKKIEPATENFVQLDVGMNGFVFAVTDEGTMFWRVGIRDTNEDGTFSIEEKSGTSWLSVGAGEGDLVSNVAYCPNGMSFYVSNENRLYSRMEFDSTDVDSGK
jgi:hypothetical protein